MSSNNIANTNEVNALEPAINVITLDDQPSASKDKSEPELSGTDADVINVDNDETSSVKDKENASKSGGPKVPWKQFFEYAKNIAKCKECREHVPRKAGNTGGMKSHMENKHKPMFNAALIEIKNNNTVHGDKAPASKKRKLDEPGNQKIDVALG